MLAEWTRGGKGKKMAEYRVSTKEDFEQFVSLQWSEINEYLDQKFCEMAPPLYSSVDIRESRTKFAAVDHNIYPAGFNNLCRLDLESAEEFIEAAIKRRSSKSDIVGIIPESNTKNIFYLDHLAVLGKAVRDAGHEVLFLSPDLSLFPGGEDCISLLSKSNYDIKIFKMIVAEGIVRADKKNIDFVILNHDQSHPLPVDWSSIHTPIAPSPFIGWNNRKKAKHFHFYHQVVQNFGEAFSVDPNLMEARFEKVQDVDFETKEGLEKLALAVDRLKNKVGHDGPVYVKASQGTYGMGIHVVHSGEEILSMNRKTRNKMDIGKNKIKFTEVIVQEGIETVLKYDDMPAEVAIYLIDGKSVGGFMRANDQKDSISNLNSKGMVFKKFCISELRGGQDDKSKEAVYTILARLSTLASCYELQEIK